MGYATRDNQGSAVKATYVELTRRGINPATKKEIVILEGRKIFKDPITDDGTKKSARGLIGVFNGVLEDEISWAKVNSEENELKVLFNAAMTGKITINNKTHYTHCCARYHWIR